MNYFSTTAFATKQKRNSFSWFFISDETRDVYLDKLAPQAFVPIIDVSGNKFVPRMLREYGELPEIRDQLLHFASVVNYERSFGSPKGISEAELLKEQGQIIERLHEKGMVGLVGANMDAILAMVMYFCALTKRAFFDYTTLREKEPSVLYNVTMPDGTVYEVSDIILTAITTPEAILFFRRMDMVTKDEQYVLEAVLNDIRPITIEGKEILYAFSPALVRYIYAQTTNVADEDKYVNTMIYF